MNIDIEVAPEFNELHLSYFYKLWDEPPTKYEPPEESTEYTMFSFKTLKIKLDTTIDKAFGILLCTGFKPLSTNTLISNFVTPIKLKD